MPPYGMQGHIGIAEETTWGTAVAATDYFKALNESLETDIDRFETINIHANLFEPDDSAGVRRTTGGIELASNPESIGFMLNGAFGINSVTVVLSGFLHENQFRPATVDVNSLHPLTPYTLEVFRDMTSSHQYAGVNFATLTLAIAPNQDLRLTADVLAKSLAPLAPTTPTFPGSPVEAFLFDTCSISLAGIGVSDMEALNVSLDNQLEGIPILNASTVIGKIRRAGAQLVRVGGTLEFPDWTQFDLFRNQTELALTANFTKANSFALLIEVPRLVYTTMPPTMTGRERVTADFEGMGRFHTGSNTALDVTLTTVNTF